MKRFIAIILCLVLFLTASVSFAATRGEENALQSAKDYLSFTHFSYTGLISQLEFEGYSSSECKYAADNCGADWYDQAAGSAKDYLAFMSFSKKGLVDQLIYEGFTKEEAEYGAAVAYGENPTKPARGPKSGFSTASSVPTPTPEPMKTTQTSSKGATQSKELMAEGNINLSNMSIDELIALHSQITVEIMSRPEFKTVKVPPGAYKVGVDIPAGKWKITASEGACEVYWGKSLDEYGVAVPYDKRIATLDDWGNQGSVSWELVEGTYIVISRNAVTFETYTPANLGF